LTISWKSEVNSCHGRRLKTMINGIRIWKDGDTIICKQFTILKKSFVAIWTRWAVGKFCSLMFMSLKSSTNST
jgi:hypothetical protein